MDSSFELEPLVSAKDKYFALAICWFLGNGLLFSWNCLLAIEDYYSHMFPRYHPARVILLIYLLFSLGTMLILTYHEAKLNTRCRNIFGYSTYFVGSVMLIVLDVVTSGRGGIGTFLGICAVSALQGIANGYVEGAMFGDLSFMSPIFVQSYLGGIPSSGTVAVTLRLITKAAFKDTKKGLRSGAILFLTISSLLELACVILYACIFPKLECVKYHRLKAASEGSKTVLADLAAAGIHVQPSQRASEYPQRQRLTKTELFLQTKDYISNLFVLFIVTMSIFPGFLYEDTGSHRLGSWYGLLLVAVFNVVELVANYIPMVKRLKITSRMVLSLACVLRFLLVPAFYFAAKYGNEGWVIMLTSLLGFSHGYLSVCIFTNAPVGYEAPEQNSLGNMLSCCLSAGLFAGSALGLLWLIGKGW